MDTETVWAGEFGDEYTSRNRVDWQARIPFWSDVMFVTGARSVFEFGCNAGWNLSAIKRCCPDVQVSGTDINLHALRQASAAGINTEVLTSELTFTAGVLIHIPPDELEARMLYMIHRSYDYVLAVEYESDKEEEINYRGQDGLLWKRPFGQMYQDMGLKLVSEGDAEGFDDCKYWLLRK